MKALVKSKAEPGIWMQDISEPVLGPNDVLIKIKMTAICGTDIHLYNWDDWAKNRISVPLVIGHEFVGEIADVGKEVKQFNIGARVSGEGHIPCGFCRCCRSGRFNICHKDISLGVTRQGCFAEYLSLPATNVYPVPPAIPDTVAAILDPFGNSTHAALSFDLVGEDVLITGAGPVGIMAVAAARHAGARYIVITDVNEYRLDIAKRMGASLALNPKKTSLTEAMNMLDMKEGFDVGLEMSGNPNAFNDILDHMNHGGKISLLGFLPAETQINWSHIILKGLQLKGIFGREMFETWYKMICMLQSGLDISPVITHQFHVNDYLQAFETMRSGQSGKVIMSWG
jgi:threonine 3-dehydrogenase